MTEAAPSVYEQVADEMMSTDLWAVTAANAPLADRAGADMAEWPEDLRIQEFPR